MKNQQWIKLPATAAALALVFSVSAQAQQDPGMGQQDPGMQQQDPGMGQQDPGMQQQEPGMEQQDPGMQQQDPGMAQPEPDQATFSSDQIERFVDAYLDIIDIQEQYTSEIEGTDGAEDARELQEQANDEMVAAIEDNGLSVPEYSEIANAMDMDPELRDQVSSKIHEREGG